MLGHALILSPHTSSCVAALSTAASRPDWQTLEDIDVPFHQHSLSLAIDEASHQRLLSSAPSTRSHALALSSALPHAGDWLNGIPSAALVLHLQDREFRCCLQYWLGVPLHSSPTPVQNVTALQTSLETTKLDVEGMEIGSCDTMPSGTSSSVPPSLLLWLLPLNSPTSFLIPSPDQLISTSLPGAVVVLLHWMCTSYLLSSSIPWVRLPSPQATLYRLESNGSSPLIFPTVGQRDWSSSLSCLRLWEVLRRTPFLLYAVLVDPLPWELAPRMHPSFPSSCSTVLQSPCGGWMAAPPAIPPPLMLSGRFSVVYVSVYFCVFCKQNLFIA